MKQKGFTIMELTIAILAISVVSIILIFPFKNNLKIARDSVRRENVNMMASIIKYDQIPNEHKYQISKKEVLKIFQENLVKLPIIESNNHYFYGHSTTSEDFFVVVCSESREKFFVAGTTQGKEDLSVIYPKQACENGSIPVGERFFPLKNPTKPIDSYLVYKII